MLKLRFDWYISQSKTMQVETIHTFKNYLYIVTSSFFSQNKVEKICLISWGRFNKTIIPLALVGYEMIIANSALRASLWRSVAVKMSRYRNVIPKAKNY